MNELPSSEQIVAEAFAELDIEKRSPTELREHFEEVFKRFFEHTLVVLERYEGVVIPKRIASRLFEAKRDDIARTAEQLRTHGVTTDTLRDALVTLFTQWYPDLRLLFLSVSQSRKTRGGRDFELEFEKLLTRLGIPFQKEKRKHRVDFMLPSNEFYERDRTRALILSAKRTLRERWREVVEELHQLRSPNIYLLTADRNISKGHVQKICREYNIHLVVWNDVKRLFPNEPLVIDYNTLVKKVIADYQRFW